MSEMDLLKRIEALENKVAELENILNTISLMEKSERITEFLQNRRRNQSLVSLFNSMSDEEIVFGSQEIENTKRMAEEQKKLEIQIRTSIENERQNIDTSVNDESLFNTGRNGQEITITRYNGFNDHTIIIPSAINGVKVTKIGSDVFKNMTCEHVVIPDSVTSIGSSAFSGCVKLKSVVIGSGVLSIEDYAFSGCKALQNVSLPENLIELGRSCFSWSGIMRIVIPSSVKTIPEYCFSYCQNLKEVVIPEGITSIENGAFEDCNQLADLIIPDSVSVVNNDLISLNCNLVFLGTDTRWLDESFSNRRFYYGRKKCKIFCRLGSAILQPARQSCCEVHPLSEYYKNR